VRWQLGRRWNVRAKGAGLRWTTEARSRTVTATSHCSSMESRSARNCVTYDPGAWLPRAPRPVWSNGDDSWTAV
jgi:hypothetical protein